ncbi:biotin--[acetyl-CoA-carboxylase] ligase [Campylobacter sp. FMV-PI01]|uniref:Biotin--[acetyl-CoA-carboxylase] ligase n=1 Tax=Campylobacter portucalensis TaxID=2608384 RepID=A0A6L5WHH7_9BACT|nr:biotin--[acetyl-CoA-carboxylase] ligase [Campylobacter portucalensis]MSN96630.1 biotin--[acetyl-CoA-carboxylase] ligase [Campylobacter portucalensis]
MINFVIKSVDESISTQSELIENLKNGIINPPFALIAKKQIKGYGSRGNEWKSDEGNLYFSFCIDEKDLSSTIPPPSFSIYFAFLMKEFLSTKGSKIWLKWPNDFYLNNKKIGGVITTKIKTTYVCGIGLNLTNSPDYAGVLDINITPNEVVFGFLNILKNKIPWKQIFSKFVVEFELSKKFYTNINGNKFHLNNANLYEDGSIMINNKRVYSLR